MSYTAASTLLPYISPFLKECPDPIVSQALYVAARQFVIDTEAWLAWLDTIASVAAQTTYTLTPPTGAVAVIRRIKKVKVNDINQASQGYFFNDVDTSTLTFHEGHIPQSTGTDIDIRVSLIPTLSCVNYPDWLINKWGMAIVDKTLCDLHAMRTKPWFDPDGYRVHGAHYMATCSDAKVELMDHAKDSDLYPRRLPFGSF